MRPSPATITGWAARVLPAALALGVAGCDTPENLCEDLARKTCERAVECVAPDEDVLSCTRQLVAQLDCSRVVEVTDDYDTCMSDLSDDTCGDLFPMDLLALPMSCTGVLLVP